jgi:hypothetical protein
MARASIAASAAVATAAADGRCLLGDGECGQGLRRSRRARTLPAVASAAAGWIGCLGDSKRDCRLRRGRLARRNGVDLRTRG